MSFCAAHLKIDLPKKTCSFVLLEEGLGRNSVLNTQSESATRLSAGLSKLCGRQSKTAESFETLTSLRHDGNPGKLKIQTAVLALDEVANMNVHDTK